MNIYDTLLFVIVWIMTLFTQTKYRIEGDDHCLIFSNNKCSHRWGNRQVCTALARLLVDLRCNSPWAAPQTPASAVSARLFAEIHNDEIHEAVPYQKGCYTASCKCPMISWMLWELLRIYIILIGRSICMLANNLLDVLNH